MFSDTILESVAESIFTVDREFRVTFFNRAAENLTGLRRADILGKPCREVFQSDLCQADCPLAAVLRSGESVRDIHATIRCRQGRPIRLTVSASLLGNGDVEPTGGVIVFHRMDDDALRPADMDPGVPHFQGIVGSHRRMRQVFQLIRDVAGSDAPVFIQGETGTGKELFADAIQATSARRERPFVKVNCAVLPPELLASELFGHTRGAFTGAIKDRIGRFEMANHGTIFLDEIAEMAPNMQLNLLRILQDGSYERLGDSVTRRVDVRIIAATNVDIGAAIAAGRFREDLFYRLNVIPLGLPPLRERLSDIEDLAACFIRKFAGRYGKPLRGIDADVLAFLKRYRFPGNVRELENILEYAVVRARPNTSICLCNLPAHLRDGVPCPTEGARKVVPDTATDHGLRDLLDRYDWNQSKVARILGVHRTTVWRRMKELGIAR